MRVTSTSNDGDPNASDRVAVFNARLARWADRLADTDLTAAQADGLACVACGRDYLTDPTRSVPVGHGLNGGQVFVCTECDDAEAVAQQQAQNYSQRVGGRVMADIDKREVPLLLIADVLDLTVPEVEGRCDGEIPWVVAELVVLASLLGVKASAWLEGVEGEL